MGYPDDLPIFKQKIPPEPSADPETDVVAQDSAARGCANDETDIELRLGAGVDGCTNENGFARQGDARALEHHDDKDGSVAVVGNQSLN